MLNLPCMCDCHKCCHTCGREFIEGRPHQNCGDTVSTKGGEPASYSIPLPNTEAFNDFEREGYGDHAPDA